MKARGAEYAELHAASAFSFLRGGSGPEALAEAAAEAGLRAAALCDRDGVYGAPRFHKACRERGLRAIVGAELRLEDGGVLPVLVENAAGYANLCRLVTGAQLGAGTKGTARFGWDGIAEHAEGLVVMSGDADGGALAAALARGGAAEANRFLGQLKRCFPGKGQCHVELQHHRRRGDPARLRALDALAERHDLPVVATNGVRYATPRERKVADIFTCLRHHTHLDAAGRLLAPNAERNVKRAEEMAALFRDYPDALRATVELSERLRFSLEDPGYRFPDYPVPTGETADSFLRKLTWFGAEQRYGGLTPEIRRQLEHELGIIARLGFSGYFLIVWDIVNFCRESDIMVQGRGSAANSAVCYSLGITAVDPIGCGLLFERFLSEGRQGWPDIDLDLPSGDRRERVIQEVYRRYGRRGAAMTANVITYRGRGAVREVGKALNFPPAMIDRFSSLWRGGGEGAESGDLAALLEEAGLRRDHPRTPVLIELCGMVRGLPRHLGQHSGGMIVCAGRLDSVVPLEPASMPGRVVAQWDKDDCEDLGIVKVDLLGLGMMAAMQDSLRYARERGRNIDLARIPKDDPATFAMMQAADTIGVFQIESRAQQATLPRMKPACFYDVAIEVAIIRPGPIQGNLVHPYLERRQGRAPVDYLDERLKPVLERTLGVPLFQEQVLRIAMILADFTGAEAEELRRALNFHRSPERLRRAQHKLRAAMERKGVAPRVIEGVVEATGSFALYGFPESHAISFALIAYASTYLKVHYPAEFYCGLLNNQPMGFYSPATLIQDARRRGVRFHSPCVAASLRETTVVADKCLQLGLLAVQGLRRRDIDRILAARAERPFASLADFRRRTALDTAPLRLLARAGALRAFGGDRRRTLWEVEEAPDWDGGLMVAEEASSDRDAPDEPPAEAMTLLERIQADYETLGLTAGPHPMRLFRRKLGGLLRAADLPRQPDGRRVRVGGAAICRQRPGTAKGFVFISLEDETGIINVITDPAFFERCRRVLVESPFLEFTGRLQNREGVIHVRAESARPLVCDGLPPTASHDFH